MLDERRLHGVQLAVFHQPLDRNDFPPFVLHGKSETRVDAFAINQHCAGAAGALIASFLRARKSQVIAQGIEKRDSRIDNKDPVRTVDVKRYVLKLVR